MVEQKIDFNGVTLRLYRQRSKVRIVDENGNQASAPTQAICSTNSFVEWMVTNPEIRDLMKNFLTKDDTISKITQFIRDSQYTTREAAKTAPEELDSLFDFKVYIYSETFYSFEKILNTGIRIKITFKMGDFTLAPHMFVLLPFSLAGVQIMNKVGVVREGAKLGSGCYCNWTPSKKDIHEIVVGLSHVSTDHRDALRTIIQDMDLNE